MKSSKGQRGQFVIIAVMLSAIMIISIGAIMNRAITYYKHEPWEEYSTLIGDIEINSRKIVELSLASNTSSKTDADILGTNLEKWRSDLTDIYPSSGIVLIPDYSEGIETLWYKSTSTSKASAEFDLDILSIGLKGYNFAIVTSLNLKIISFTQTTTTTTTTQNNLVLEVNNENNLGISGLGVQNFDIQGAKRETMSVTSEYDAISLKYRIYYDSDLPVGIKPQVQVCDQRGILVVGLTP